MFQRFCCMLLALMLSFSCCVSLAENAEATEEEIAEWAELAGTSGEEDEADDSLAAGAAVLTAEEEALFSELGDLLDETTDDTEVETSNLEINEKLPDNVVNILLLGLDNRTLQLETGRSDAIIICSINKDTGSITLTSFARDTAVVVPGYKNRQRLNVAFKFGSKDGDLAKGAELAMKTINRNFGMNLSRYVLVNIHGLADIIESLGGVDMDMTKAEASAINYELFVKEPMDSNKGRSKLKVANGVQHLDGMQAVTYGRIRNLKNQNDINRNARQRNLLEVLLKKVMQDMDIMKFVGLVQSALPHGRTNLTLDELMNLGMCVLSGEAMHNLTGGENVLRQFSIPMEGEFGYKKFGNVSLIYISEKRMTKTLSAWQEFIYGQTF